MNEGNNYREVDVQQQKQQNCMKATLTLIIIVLCLVSCGHVSGQNTAEVIKNPQAMKLYNQAMEERSKGSAGFKMAIELLNKADQIEPRNAIILHERGLVKIDSRIDKEGGFEDLQKSIDYSKNEKDKLIRYHNRGIAYMEMGEMEKACEDWLRAGEEGEYYIEEYCNK